MKKVFLTENSTITIIDGEVYFTLKGEIIHKCSLNACREVSDLTYTERKEAERNLAERGKSLSDCYYVADGRFFITDALSAWFIAEDKENKKQKGTRK